MVRAISQSHRTAAGARRPAIRAEGEKRNRLCRGHINLPDLAPALAWGISRNAFGTKGFIREHPRVSCGAGSTRQSDDALRTGQKAEERQIGERDADRQSEMV